MTKKNGAMARPSTRTDVAEEWVGKEIFIYDHASSDEVHNLNTGAALIWLLCDGTRDVKSIASAIAEEFDLARNQVLQEVEATVEYFGTLNLLENGQMSAKES
ncbi:MAG: PqqD family protein [Anaerolineales bacterium]